MSAIHKMRISALRRNSSREYSGDVICALTSLLVFGVLCYGGYKLVDSLPPRTHNQVSGRSCPKPTYVYMLLLMHAFTRRSKLENSVRCEYSSADRCVSDTVCALKFSTRPHNISQALTFTSSAKTFLSMHLSYKLHQTNMLRCSVPTRQHLL